MTKTQTSTPRAALQSGGGPRPDEFLVAAAIKGDVLAFDRLASRHRRAAVRAAAAISGPSRAEAVVEKALLLAHRELASLSDGAKFSRWLTAITRWLALRSGGPGGSQALGRISPGRSVLETLGELATAPRRNAAGDMRLIVALESLPPEYAEVIRYHLLHDLPHRRIAKFLDIPLSTVKWRYLRGKDVLCRALTPEHACSAACREGCVPFTAKGLSAAFPEKPASFFEAAAARFRAATRKHAPRGVARLERLDFRTTRWMAGHGIQVLRISLGVIFFWFGVLKFFPGFSPAQELATRTISGLTMGLVPPGVSLIVLAIWECAIGLGLIFGVFMRATLVLLFLQMLGTFAPLLLFPHEAFTHVPGAPTLEGQYIIKNLVLISAGLVLGGTVRGGAIEADPEVIQLGRQTQMRSREA